MQADPNVAEVLNQALPYIQRFRGKTFVVKYGGSAMRDPSMVEAVLRNVLLLRLVGINVILVHGGGPEIDGLLARLGIEKKVLGGLRVTDDDTMEAVEMALSKANKALAANLNSLGGKAVGISGRDADLLIAHPISADLGHVGEIMKVNESFLTILVDAGYLPVVATVASGPNHRALNINADTAAGAIAAALKASKLILMTDTDGVRDNPSDPKSRITELSVRKAREMIEDGRADRGMIPKLKSAIESLDAGVERVHLINGGTPNALLLEVFTDGGIGTMMGGSTR